MAARSVDVTFNNETDSTMHRTYMKLDHGAWCENSSPPETIAAHESGQWCSESDGFMTGTEGTVHYHLDGEGTVKVHWDNPYSGSNSYKYSAPKNFEIEKDGGSGDNARVTFTLKPASS